jgi:hypothetical protein
MTMQLASRFAPRSPVLRSESPLSDDPIRSVQGIDQNLRLNRALWLLADGLRQLKG